MAVLRSNSDSSSSSAGFSWRGFSTASLPDVPKWVAMIGRAGHFAKGAVYFVIGFLAFQVAIGAGRNVSGARGAIREIESQPYGRILLALVAFGLLCYTIWRWVQSGKDTEGHGRGAKGLSKRCAYAFSGISYLLLGVFAATLAIGISTQDGGGGGHTYLLLSTVPGRIFLGIAGTLVALVGVYFGYKAYAAKFMQKYDLASMSEKMRKTALVVGRLGLPTRGIAFVIIGGFLLSSAILGTNDGEISGMSDALSAIADQAYGPILLGLTGFGLMCYALHMLLLGRFHCFNVKEG